MRGTILILFFLFATRLAGQTLPIPERIVSVNCENKRTDEVLQDIASQGKFEFAWDAHLFDPAKPVTLHVQKITVRRAINLIFGNTITFRVKGNYLVLIAAPPPVVASAPAPKKREFLMNGYITDSQTGEKLAHVSVYDSISLAAALSDEYGNYSLKLAAGTQPVKIKISRENYLDTFLIITPASNQTADISLRKIPPPPAPPQIVTADTISKTNDSTPVVRRRKVENFRFFDSLIGYEQIMQARNLKETLRRNGQVSLLPFVSTNGPMSGTVRNKYSFNLIGGYTGGTDVVEIGGGFNIDRGDVKWVQLAGGVNLTGGNMKGVQAAGGLNINLGTLYGVQLSGGSNFLMDTLNGFQVAGGSNFINGKVNGFQIAGGVNIASKDLYGMQIAGNVNVTLGKMNAVQISGGLNYGGQVTGFQGTGGVNFCRDTLTGAQVAGGLNYARTMRGAQIAPLNVAKKVSGFQIGVLNFADTCSGGIPFGVLSFVRKGIHEFEMATTEKGFINLAFRTGVPKFYNILNFGFDPGYPDRVLWTFGYGIGHRFLIQPKFNLALDLNVHHVNAGKLSDFTNEWAQLQFTAEWRPWRFFSIAAGPVFHYYITGAEEDQLSLFHPKPIFTGAPAAGFRDMGWVGASVSLRFF